MYECERLFGAVRGQEVCRLVEKSTGEGCPCKVGGKCPLVDGTPVMLTLLPTREAAWRANCA